MVGILNNRAGLHLTNWAIVFSIEFEVLYIARQPEDIISLSNVSLLFFIMEL